MDNRHDVDQSNIFNIIHSLYLFYHELRISADGNVLNPVESANHESKEQSSVLSHIIC